MIVSAFLMLAGAGLAGAEEKLGVKIYDGAKYNEAVSKAVNKALSVEAYCYRTSDSVAKVAEFYKKLPGCTVVSVTKEGAMFKKNDIDITIQSPWLDLGSAKMNDDTLISIVKS
jgi:hypothetical protein